MNTSLQTTPQNPNNLTKKEFEVLAIIIEGKTAKQIASELHNSPKTIECHVAKLFDKFELSERCVMNLYKAAMKAGYFYLDKTMYQFYANLFKENESLN